MTTTAPSSSADAGTVRLRIEGMNCAGCVGKVESALSAAAGVERASVSLADASAVVVGSDLSPEALCEVVVRSGFEAKALGDEKRSVAEQRTEIEERQARSARKWRRLTITGFSIWVPLAFLHWAGGAVGLYSGEHPSGIWLWIIAGLATLNQVFVGQGFYASAWKAAKSMSTNMDTLIAIGATAAYGFSMVVFILLLMGSEAAHGQPLYFGESAGLLALISLGHWLEARTSAAAGSAVRELLALQPDEVTQLESASATSGTTVPSSTIRPDDLMLIRPGERVAVDGVIVDGASTLDESVVTGESLPVERTVEHEVIAGSMNLTGRLIIKATTDGRDTTIARIAEMVRQAQSGKANIQRIADKVCGIFVPAVLLVAAVTFIGWIVFDGEGGFITGLISATTVLVISCPCALGLATPTAIMVGSGAASKAGILVKSPETLERAARTRVILMDKTGTLTHGRVRVLKADDEALRLASGLAINSNHPLSLAVVAAAEGRNLSIPPVQKITEKAGQGIHGSLDDRDIALLSLSGAKDEYGIEPPDDNGHDETATASLVIRDGSLVGLISFADEIRNDAADLVRSLHERNIRPILLTGDRQAVALALAESIGLSADEVHAELRPEDKVRHVRDEADRNDGAVAMVGDGINDAAALAEASARGGIGIAVGTGTNIAIESADVVIPGEHLGSVLDLLPLSRETLKTIKQNLFLSFVYNTLAIPAAALGLLGVHGPLIAAAAMGVSDICVIGNSLRLRSRLARRYGSRSQTT